MGMIKLYLTHQPRFEVIYFIDNEGTSPWHDESNFMNGYDKVVSDTPTTFLEKVVADLAFMPKGRT